MMMPPMTSAEFNVKQSLIDQLDAEWLPETYYTLEPSSVLPKNDIIMVLIDAMRPFLGAPANQQTMTAMQQSVDSAVLGRYACAEILIWSDADCRPRVIDGIKVVDMGSGKFRLAPMLNRTAIMAELERS